MPIDISQFHEGFFEEAGEHIARMETLLLELDVANPDAEKLNAIFRAAHSIKGGSGTFGLTAMKEFTHVLESLLDQLRHREVAPSTALIDVCLEAGDVLREQLSRYRSHDPDEPSHASAVAERLRAFAATHAAPQAAAPATRSGPVTTYDITFNSTLRGVKRQGAYDGLVSALRASGTLSADPEQQATSGPWHFTLAAAIASEEIRDIFDYVSVPGDTLDVEATATSASDDDEGFGFFDGAPGAPETETDPGYGFFEDAPGAPAPEVAKTVGRRDGWDGIDRRRGTDAATSIRVSLQKVDQMINLVGEMVISQSKVAKIVEGLDPMSYQVLHDATALMQRNSRDLQDSIMSTRMLPIKTVFSRFPRMVRELAASLDKDIVLSTAGDDTELDKGLLEQIADPLTHLVRNSIDHGIEAPQARIASGKSREGHITLRASHQGGNVVIEVIDDGHGLDREKIVNKARERQLEVRDGVPDHEIWQLIFAPGFSTSEVITDVSGRGVGMDIVKKNIDGLGGRIDIDSVAGHGTHLTIHLPLTLAILDGLSVRVGPEVYILPLAYIIESIQPEASAIKTITGRGEVVLFRDEYVPLLRLAEVFHVDGAVHAVEEGILVLLEASGRKAALVVDSLESQHQVVVKSLSANFRRVPGVSGATILGNGRVTLILDVPGLLHMSQPKDQYQLVAE